MFHKAKHTCDLVEGVIDARYVCIKWTKGKTK